MVAVLILMNVGVMEFQKKMSKQVCFDGWIAIIPNTMLHKWVQYGFIPNKRNLSFGILGEENTEQKKTLVAKNIYDIMHQEVLEWYDEVFAYVTNWLTENNFIKLKSGSFSGGFCATTIPDDTTKAWGAPLAKEDNKVVQIKEKFGRIVVYTCGLTVEEDIQLRAFEQFIMRKYDCEADFT